MNDRLLRLGCMVFLFCSLLPAGARSQGSAQAWPGDDFPLAPYFRKLPGLSAAQQTQLEREWRRDQMVRVRGLLGQVWKKPGAASRRLRLAVAKQAMSFGDSGWAVALLGKLVASKDPQVWMPARVLLARHQLMQFRPQAAFSVVRSWPRRNPRSGLVRYWLAGWMLRGTAAGRLGKRKEAIKSYKELVRVRAVIADVAALEHLRQLVKARKNGEVLKQVGLYLRRFPKSRLRGRMRYMQARALEKMGRCGRAIALYRALSKSRSSRSIASLGVIRCGLKLKQRKRVYALLVGILQRSPGRWLAHRSYRLLRKHYPRKSGSVALEYALARHLYRRGQFKAAERRLKRLLRKDKAKKYRAKALYLSGRTYFRLKRYTPARAVLQSYLREYPRGRRRSAARLLRIRAQYRKRKDRATVREYERFAQGHAGGYLGRKALWWAAQLTFEHGDAAHATRLFRRYIQRYPRARRRIEARLKIALIAYQKKQYDGVLRALRPLRRVGGRWGARARFWMAKAWEKKGNTAKAAQYFRRIRPFAESYYAARAMIRTHKRPLLARKPVSLYALLSDSAQERRHRLAMGRWISRRYPGQKADALAKALARRRGYRRAFLFALSGLPKHTRAELRVLVRKPKHPFDLYLLARAWNAFGNPNRTLYTAGLFRRKVPRSKRKGLPFKALLRVLYPIPFPAMYMRYGKKYGIRPLLMVGLTRQESLFNPFIVSHAGARGIAQIMPKEAKKMARKWKLRGFRIRHLFRPGLNLRMGFYHFREYLKRHNNHVPLTLAAYNAGPAALKRWLKATPGLPKTDLEAFIEYGIGYRETRIYVRYCLRWYNLYRFAFGS